MRLSARQIKEASKCFRFFHFSLQRPLITKSSREVSILNKAIQKSYSLSLETGLKPEWRRIISWVDRDIFENVDVNNEISFSKSRQKSEHILLFLKRWYNEILLPEKGVGYPGIKLDIDILNSTVSSVVPVIKVQEQPIIFSVGNVVYKDWQLYNDIEIRIQGWLVSNSLNCDEVVYHRLTIGPQGGFSQNIINMNKQHHKRTKKMATDIVRAINLGVDFPTITSRCYNCPYRRRCRI